MKIIGAIICWWTQEHNWLDWLECKSDDGRTKYWLRICCRCDKWETTRKEPK